MRRFWLLAAVLASFAVACSPSTSQGDGDGDADADADSDVECEDGDWRCYGIAYQECVGGVFDNAECDGVCVEGMGCRPCQPGERYCEENTVMECNEDGMDGTFVAECEEGQRCSGGSCSSGCEDAIRDRSNIGCEYWAVDLDNASNRADFGDEAQYAVVVANPDPILSVHVTAEINHTPFDSDDLELETVAEAEIEPASLAVLELPRRDADGDDTRRNNDDGPQTMLSSRAFRITSTAPVVAYQFNPIVQAFSNDASLLLPTSGLDNHHIVISYPPANAVVVPGFNIPPSRSYVTVLGTHEETTVHIQPTFRTFAGVETAEGPAVPQLQPGDDYVVTIGPFDVVNIETDTVSMAEAGRGMYPDLTGTVVTSDYPVAVFTGADLSVVGPLDAEAEEGTCCAEHFEAQIIPTSAMGKRFVVNRSPVRAWGTPEVDVYRVMAVVGDEAEPTRVTTTLAGEAAEFELVAGEFFAFDTAEPFILTSSQPVHVAQFLISQTYVVEPYVGDPSMLLFPALEEWRGTYVLATGRNFSDNYVVLAMPEGAAVTLDGVEPAAAGCDPADTIGELDGTTYVQVVCDVAEGAHVVDSGETPVGVTAYGYYRAGSYAYSAGSNLTRIFLF